MVAGRTSPTWRIDLAPPQVIVNEEFVRRYVAPADPLGRQLRMATPPTPSPAS